MLWVQADMEAKNSEARPLFKRFSSRKSTAPRNIVHRLTSPVVTPSHVWCSEGAWEAAAQDINSPKAFPDEAIEEGEDDNAAGVNTKMHGIEPLSKPKIRCVRATPLGPHHLKGIAVSACTGSVGSLCVCEDLASPRQMCACNSLGTAPPEEHCGECMHDKRRRHQISFHLLPSLPAICSYEVKAGSELVGDWYPQHLVGRRTDLPPSLHMLVL
eukprot:1151032-Pelagomonas_calceolata.AAC.1